MLFTGLFCNKRLKLIKPFVKYVPGSFKNLAVLVVVLQIIFYRIPIIINCISVFLNYSRIYIHGIGLRIELGAVADILVRKINVRYDPGHCLLANDHIIPLLWPTTAHSNGTKCQTHCFYNLQNVSHIKNIIYKGKFLLLLLPIIKRQK